MVLVGRERIWAFRTPEQRGQRVRNKSVHRCSGGEREKREGPRERYILIKEWRIIFQRTIFQAPRLMTKRGQHPTSIIRFPPRGERINNAPSASRCRVPRRLLGISMEPAHHYSPPIFHRSPWIPLLHGSCAVNQFLSFGDAPSIPGGWLLLWERWENLSTAGGENLSAFQRQHLFRLVLLCFHSFFLPRFN